MDTFGGVNSYISRPWGKVSEGIISAEGPLHPWGLLPRQPVGGLGVGCA